MTTPKNTPEPTPVMYQPPRIFVWTFVALIVTILTLLNVVSWPVLLAVAALAIPLAAWYFLLKRNTPKHPQMRHPSPGYVGYFAVLMIVVYASRFWEIDSVPAGLVKWLVLFGVLLLCVTGMGHQQAKTIAQEIPERSARQGG